MYDAFYASTRPRKYNISLSKHGMLITDKNSETAFYVSFDPFYQGQFLTASGTNLFAARKNMAVQQLEERLALYVFANTALYKVQIIPNDYDGKLNMLMSSKEKLPKLQEPVAALSVVDSKMFYLYSDSKAINAKMFDSNGNLIDEKEGLLTYAPQQSKARGLILPSDTILTGITPISFQNASLIILTCRSEDNSIIDEMAIKRLIVMDKHGKVIDDETIVAHAIVVVRGKVYAVCENKSTGEPDIELLFNQELLTDRNYFISFLNYHTGHFHEGVYKLVEPGIYSFNNEGVFPLWGDVEKGNVYFMHVSSDDKEPSVLTISNHEVSFCNVHVFGEMGGGSNYILLLPKNSHSPRVYFYAVHNGKITLENSLSLVSQDMSMAEGGIHQMYFPLPLVVADISNRGDTRVLWLDSELSSPYLEKIDGVTSKNATVSQAVHLDAQTAYTVISSPQHHGNINKRNISLFVGKEIKQKSDVNLPPMVWNTVYFFDNDFLKRGVMSQRGSDEKYVSIIKPEDKKLVVKNLFWNVIDIGRIE